MPCLHSFCKKCLEQQLEQQGSSDGSIKCPTCATVSPLPSGGVSSLPSNLWLAHQAEVSTYQHKIEDGGSVPCDRCMKKTSGSAVAFCCNCCLFLCSSCKEDHQWWRETINHELVDVGEKKSGEDSFKSGMKFTRRPVMCVEHPNEELKFYCDTCQCLVCRDCIVMDHINHKRSYPKVVARRERESLLETLKEAEDVLAKVEAAISSRGKMKEQVEIQKKHANEDIKQQFEKIYISLQEREQVLHNKCEEIANQKLTVLTMEMEDMEKFKERIAFSTQIASGAQELMPAELLSTKKTIQDHLLQDLTSFSQLELEPGENDDISVVVDTAALDEVISEFGSVSEACDPAQCTVEEGLVIPLATVGKEREVRVALNDSKGQMVQEKEPVTARLIATSNGSVLPVNVRCESGHTSLSFTPNVVGEHQLIIKVKTKPIAGSPYKIWSRQSRALTNVTSHTGAFSLGSYQAEGVSVHHSGDLFASLFNAGYVQVFSSDGNQKIRIGSPGSGDGQFNQPYGLVIVGDVLYVVDRGNHRVQKFTLTGDYLGQFGSYGSGKGQLYNPSGICSDGKGHVLVADSSNNRVQVFTAYGEFTSCIPCIGAPYDVAVDNAGNIHVTMQSSNCVVVYSADGKQLTNYYSGVSITSPTGIAIDENGYRYIGSYNKHQIYVVNPEEYVVSCITCYYPRNIYLDTHGDVYVASYNDCYVYKY